MAIRHILAAALLAAGGLATAQAAPLATDGSWASFSVDPALAGSGGLEWIDDGGAALSFSFVVGAGQQALVTVVDAGFAGDTFKLFDGNTLLGSSSAVPIVQYDPLVAANVDYEAILGDPNYSRALLTLGAGTHTIYGVLDQSVLLGADPLNATIGGIKLQVSPVPEPASLTLLLAGLGLLGLARRRAR